MKVRSKNYLVYQYGTIYKMWIHIHPQQHWEVNDCGVDKDSIIIRRKCVSMEISRDDFEKYFVEVEENED